MVAMNGYDRDQTINANEQGSVLFGPSWIHKPETARQGQPCVRVDKAAWTAINIEKIARMKDMDMLTLRGSSTRLPRLPRRRCLEVP